MSRERPLILNSSPFDSRAWKWFDGRLDADFIHVDSTPQNVLERWVRKPALSRYRAALRGAWESRQVDLLVTHSPHVTAWTERARRYMGVRTPHLAFAFNFTRLPHGWRRRTMASAFQSVDRFIVFSRFELELYAREFRIPPERLEMIYWGVGDPHITSLPDGIAEPYICAVGGEGRDYATFLAAMKKLPHIRAEIVARPHSVGTDLPVNVRLRTNIPLGQANAIIQNSQFMVLPLLHSEVPCGHVTMVTAMKMAKALVVTGSLGISDYVMPGETALLAGPEDPDAMAEQISRLWGDSTLRQSLSATGKSFAEKNFTEQSTINHVRRIIAEMT